MKFILSLFCAVFFVSCAYAEQLNYTPVAGTAAVQGNANNFTAENTFSFAPVPTANTVSPGTYFYPQVVLPSSAQSGAIIEGLLMNQFVTGNGSNVSGGDNLSALFANNFNGTGVMPYMKGIEANVNNNSSGTITAADSYFSNISNGAGGTISTYVMYGGYLGTNNGSIGTFIFFGCDTRAGGTNQPGSEYCIYSGDSHHQNYLAGPLSAGSYSIAGGASGVSCSGTPSASFATVNGIVTHC